MDKPTVLIVEDKRRHLRLIRDHLGDKGYNVIEATNVEDALEQIQSFLQRHGERGSKPQLIVLTGVEMPESSGAETSRDAGIKFLRQLYDKEKIQIPVIFVTTRVGNVIKIAKQYKVPIVPKPLDIKQLLREIRKVSAPTAGPFFSRIIEKLKNTLWI